MTTRHANTHDFDALTTNVSTRRVRWREDRKTAVTVLASVRYRVGVVEHVRRTTVRQRGGEPTCDVNDEATFEDFPTWVRRELQSDSGVSQWQ
ncbi:hypothetical protein [Halopelagius fulvigenes]|uniref:Uncharacterized protein n=1 Tax=Halopelagius fulvigenes TaxID=1198324 RepID=A0ABD5U2I9_9EURY